MTAKDVRDLFLREDDFLLTTHVSPDGDGLGVQGALFFALRGAGKKVKAHLADPLPKMYRFLPHREWITTGPEFPEHRWLVVADCASIDRLKEGCRREEFGKILNIDHHDTNPNFGDVNWVDPQAAASGVLVYRLLKVWKKPITPEIAQCLYCSLIHDTGNFRFSNTSAEVLEAAAELVRCGACPQEVSDHVFGNHSFNRIQLLARGLSRMERHAGGKIALIAVARSDFEETETTQEDTEILVDYVRDLEDVHIGVLLREQPDGKIKLSLRSRFGRDVSGIARSFGGGGHRPAAGATLKGPLAAAREKVLNACISFLMHEVS